MQKQIEITEEQLKIIDAIYEGYRIGYAFVYSACGAEKQEYVMDLSPENIANFIGSQKSDIEKIEMTTFTDRLVVRTNRLAISECPNQELYQQIMPILEKIQNHEIKAVELPIIPRDVYEEYVRQDEEQIDYAEVMMLEAEERELSMNEELKTRAEKIMEAGNVGYAYLTLTDGSPRQRFTFNMTPKNIANFIGKHFYDARQMILTDIGDQLIVDTFGGFLNRCPNPRLCMEIQKYLIPIQQGDVAAEDFPMLTEEELDEYNQSEDEEELLVLISMR